MLHRKLERVELLQWRGESYFLIMILLQMFQEKMEEVSCLQEGIGKVEKIQICQRSFHLLNWRRQLRLS